MIVSITRPMGPSVANAISAKVRETDTPEPLYMVQAVCQAWNQSRVSVRVRSVGGRFIKQYRDMNKCMWDGNKHRINAHIHNVF